MAVSEGEVLFAWLVELLLLLAGLAPQLQVRPLGQHWLAIRVLKHCPPLQTISF